jgi:hypothetical protein
MKTTIQELESHLEVGLSKLRSPEYKPLEAYLLPLVPQNYRVHVSLLDKSGRKKKKNASADNWSPESGEIRIYFEAVNPSSPENLASVPIPQTRLSKPKTAVPSDPISDLARALDRAESRPGYDFVALKWFRDVFLPAEGLGWTQADSMRQDVLRQAIEKRIVLTSKVPNPKSPQFPVTAIRLNRLLQETQIILGGETASGCGFEPVEIRGESLSETVLRERR